VNSRVHMCTNMKWIEVIEACASSNSKLLPTVGANVEKKHVAQYFCYRPLQYLSPEEDHQDMTCFPSKRGGARIWNTFHPSLPFQKNDTATTTWLFLHPLPEAKVTTMTQVTHKNPTLTNPEPLILEQWQPPYPTLLEQEMDVSCPTAPQLVFHTH
jgi:hypothetical protein